MGACSHSNHLVVGSLVDNMLIMMLWSAIVFALLVEILLFLFGSEKAHQAQRLPFKLFNSAEKKLI